MCSRDGYRHCSHVQRGREGIMKTLGHCPSHPTRPTVQDNLYYCGASDLSCVRPLWFGWERVGREAARRHEHSCRVRARLGDRRAFNVFFGTAYKGRSVMMCATWVASLVICGIVLLGESRVIGQDWPQWRGPNRDAKASGFKAPTTWPKELTKKWSVTIGNGVATPSLADGKLIGFSRQDDNEVVRCLNAATGEELWKDEYPAKAPTGGASGFPGPRASPTIADGKVVTFGADGTLTCYDINTSRQLWRKKSDAEFDGSLPMFFTSSSPIVVDGICIAQLGGEERVALSPSI